MRSRFNTVVVFTTPPTRHYISLTRIANIHEMHEWIVIPGMPGYLGVCMHGGLDKSINGYSDDLIGGLGHRRWVLMQEN